MLEFIVKNYYIILVVCILLIFAIIGYIIDYLKNKNTSNEQVDTYMPEEDIFIQKIEQTPEEEEKTNEENEIDDLLENYNKEKNK